MSDRDRWEEEPEPEPDPGWCEVCGDHLVWQRGFLICRRCDKDWM